jgi:Domain of unknown function (DUF4403)
VALDRKNFHGGVHGFADISADIDTNWCPHLQAVPSFDWTDKGQLEIVNNVWLGIEGQVGGKINDQLNAAVGRVISSIKCEDIKAAVGKVWHPYSFPISLSNESKSVVFVCLEPKSIGFSGFKYEDTALKLALEIDAVTRVMTSPLTPGASAPLPPLQRINETSDRLNIKVPITASYDEVAVVAKNFLKDHIFEADVSSRHVKISVDDVVDYPTAEKLAIGMHFSASTGHQVFDTKGKGWVYVLAEPVLDQANQVVGLRNVTYTRQLDNALWSALSAVFDTKIRKVIQDHQTRRFHKFDPPSRTLRASLDRRVEGCNGMPNWTLAAREGA